MKKIKISEDLVPLSKNQRIVLIIIIACFFQFLFFFAPVLASEIVASNEIKMDATNKSEADPIVTELIKNKNISIDEKIDEKTENIEEKLTEEELIIENSTNELELKIKVVRTSIHTITAYNSEPAQTDDTPCITANGFNVCEHGEEDTIAANFLKFGTKVRIPELYGDRIFIVRDRMNKRYNDRIDIWMKEKNDALQFGIKVAKIEVVEFVD